MLIGPSNTRLNNWVSQIFSVCAEMPNIDLGFPDNPRYRDVVISQGYPWLTGTRVFGCPVVSQRADTSGISLVLVELIMSFGRWRWKKTSVVHDIRGSSWDWVTSCRNIYLWNSEHTMVLLRLMFSNDAKIHTASIYYDKSNFQILTTQPGRLCIYH